jgi:hypothetical protein
MMANIGSCIKKDTEAFPILEGDYCLQRRLSIYVSMSTIRPIALSAIVTYLV